MQSQVDLLYLHHLGKMSVKFSWVFLYFFLALTRKTGDLIK